MRMLKRKRLPINRLRACGCFRFVDCGLRPSLVSFFTVLTWVWENRRRFASKTFDPISWMCKTSAAVSDSSAESDITSSAAGVPALQLWDCVSQTFSHSDAEGTFNVQVASVTPFVMLLIICHLRWLTTFRPTSFLKTTRRSFA